MSHEAAVSLDGGRVRVDRVSRTVLVQGEVAHLGGRAFDLLQALIAQRERVIGKDELMDLVWPGLVVEENNLHVQVTTLRKVLGRQALVTVPGRGYRLALLVDDAMVPAAAPPVPTAAAPGETALHGRDLDLARLEAECAAGRCITLVGAAGVGKTALARAWRARRAERAAPPLWVDMTPVRDAALLPTLLAGACGVAITGAQPWPALAAAMQGRGLELVLDNAEHLLAAVAEGVRVLLEGAPDTLLVVTSQAPLRIEREWVHRLESLAVPTEGEVDAENDEPALLAFSAVACFVDQVRRADRRFVADGPALRRVARLARRLDGLPLALRLAAARVPLIGLAGVEQRLEQRLKLLAGGARDADPRHGSLVAALDWSCALLTAEEQAVFEALGVMHGEFGLDLGAAVAGADDEWAAVEAMAALVDRSLLELADGGTEPRYRMLDSTRAYARERLVRSGRLADVSRRAAALLTTRFAEAGDRDPVFLARLHADAGDDEAALAQWQRAAERAAAVNHLVAMEMHLSEALAILRKPGMAADAGRRRHRLALLLQLGAVLGLTHGLSSKECESAYQEALSLTDADDALEARFVAVFGLFFTQTMRLEVTEAQRSVETLIALAAGSGDERLLLQADHAVYSRGIMLGDIASTVAAAESGYRRYRPVDSDYHCRHFAGHDPGLCSAGHAALAHYYAGRIDEGERYAQALRTLRTQIAHPPSQIIGHSLDAWLMTLAGAIGEARVNATRMLALCRKMHVPVWEGFFTIIEGVCAALDPLAPDHEAPERMVAAHERVLATGTRFRLPAYRAWIADACAALQCTDTGLQQVDLALAEMDAQREWINQPLALTVRARLLEQAGDPTGARADWQAALRSAELRGMGLFVLRAATGLAALDAAEGRHDRALQRVTEALRPFDEGWHCLELTRSRALLARLASGRPGLRAVT